MQRYLAATVLPSWTIRIFGVPLHPLHKVPRYLYMLCAVLWSAVVLILFYAWLLVSTHNDKNEPERQAYVSCLKCECLRSTLKMKNATLQRLRHAVQRAVAKNRGKNNCSKQIIRAMANSLVTTSTATVQSQASCWKICCEENGAKVAHAHQNTSK